VNRHYLDIAQAECERAYTGGGGGDKKGPGYHKHGIAEEKLKSKDIIQ